MVIVGYNFTSNCSITDVIPLLQMSIKLPELITLTNLPTGTLGYCVFNNGYYANIQGIPRHHCTESDNVTDCTDLLHQRTFNISLPPRGRQKTTHCSIVVPVSIKPSVILKPSWSQIFSGETVTLRCQIQGGGTHWTYEWRTPNRNSPTSSEYRISRVTYSDSGEYRCYVRSGDHQTGWSDAFRLSVLPTPRATVSSDRSIIPAGDRVRLSCSVDTSEGWNFDWFRRESETSPSIKYNKPDRVTEGGLYSCRGGRGDPVYYTQNSSEVTIYKTGDFLEPSWSQTFSGETVTLRCQIQGGGTQWTYEWRTPNRNSPTSSEYRINRVTESDSGEYRCCEKPQPVLSVSPSWLSPGASVTLSCQVHHPSAGWRFFWYQVVPKPLSSSYNYELLSGHSNGTEQNSYIIHGQKHTAGYVCRAGRQPEYLTDYSQPKFVWSEDVDPAASLSVNPDRVQHFSSLSVSLSCEGNSTEWRVKRFTDTGLSDCSIWRTRTGSSCTTKLYWSGVFWCESGSGEFSNAVNITVQNHDGGIILESPIHPVTEGDPATLSCRLKKQELFSDVIFYHNNKLLLNDGRGELKMSAVSKSDEGFYRCEHSGKKSPQSWMSVKAVPSSFSPLLIVGPVIGIVLIIFVLLLWRCRQPKGRPREPEEDVVYSEMKPESSGFTPMYAEINRQHKAKKKDKSGPSSGGGSAHQWPQVFNNGPSGSARAVHRPTTPIVYLVRACGKLVMETMTTS
ncbi:uncharacterized protein si:ch211-163c2.2 [Nematolebias whitei]|uniref:uncharacterized protein si:ch211-163c2.2 n=1 Tax=Nematolebias whitei TaxID=451745 RepID=UPI0018977DB4|nr:uncharacterized protein si:ch211-163c2.2 [Nematolebias whitei]